MKYFEDFPWVRTFAGKFICQWDTIYIIWGLKSFMAGCSVVRAHSYGAQLEIELLCRTVDDPYTVALIMPLTIPYCRLGIMMKPGARPVQTPVFLEITLWHSVKVFVSWVEDSTQTVHTVGVVILLLLFGFFTLSSEVGGDLGHREVRWLVQDHTTSRWSQACVLNYYSGLTILLGKAGLSS